MTDVLLCSDCFTDLGLRLDAAALGRDEPGRCRHCNSTEGRKLGRRELEDLAYRFFVRGTVNKSDYGAAPGLQFNDLRYPEDSVSFPPWLQADAKLISDTLKIGIFYYGPRLWMIGEVEPLIALQDPEQRESVIERILKEYPPRVLASRDTFFRLRKNPRDPADPSEFDSPPLGVPGAGRLDSPEFPVMYASPDVEVCVHECRVTVEDELFLASLSATQDLRLLDLTAVLEEPGVTEFESLDIAVHMLFLAAPHSYDISRAIAKAALAAGFDGIVFGSYFSLVRTGAMPFETVYGLSVRRFRSQVAYAQAHTIPNLGLFGRPLLDGRVRITCINRLVLNRLAYDLCFGPGSY